MAKYTLEPGNANLDMLSGILASMKEVVHQLVLQFFQTDNIALSLSIQNLLVGLLVGPNSSPQMWRRILDDRDIYTDIFWSCSLRAVTESSHKERKRPQAICKCFWARNIRVISYPV